SPATVIFRQNQIELDNGNCRGATTLDFFTGSPPTKIAPCKFHEVDVPHVTGETLAYAEQRLIGQPLQYHVVSQGAAPGARVGIVVGQRPRSGTLSAYDTVTLYVSKALDGLVPRFVGMSVAQARARAAKLNLRVHVTGGRAGRVVAQLPHAGRASGPGLD